MTKILIVAAIMATCALCQAQLPDFPMGRISYRDMGIQPSPKDSDANAMVINEQGKAFFDDDTGNLIYEYYVKLKIFNKNGFAEATFAVPLLKNENKKSLFISVEASTYNLVNNKIVESKMDEKAKFKESNTYHDLIKFTLPNIQEGSVIEVRYRTESPFFFNLHHWEFQSNIPKLHSEYTTQIPAVYDYNITLRGFLKLAINESSLVKDCYRAGNGGKADCTLSRYGMENIPAFRTEDYMTARKNFLSVVYFDLSEIHYFTGRVDKIQKQWKDVDDELSQRDDFGKQIKKAKDILSDQIKRVVGAETEDLKKANLIYDFTKSWYKWNNIDAMLTDQGVKKAFETRQGNTAEINLSLLGGLQDAGLNASPVVLSTRSNGSVIDIQPVLSGFNYVIVQLDLGGTSYLLDATSSVQPFGVLPLKCLNGKGRLIGRQSSWIDVQPKAKFKRTTMMDMTLGEDGSLTGTITVSSMGYDAVRKRTEMVALDSQGYLEKLRKGWNGAEVSNYRSENLEDAGKPLIEKAVVKMPSDTPGASTIYLNPFFSDRIEKNPFHSAERNYPVDYGAPIDETFILSLAYPVSLMIDEIPKDVALALPSNGGHFLFSVTQLGNKLSVKTNLTLAKPIYDPQEYHYLKELYSRIIQTQQLPIVFKNK